MGWTIPPPEEVLAGLKDFQRATVEHVFSRLYAENASGRYLVADEVGLGKTLVARGVIAKTIARLKADPACVDAAWKHNDFPDALAGHPKAREERWMTSGSTPRASRRGWRRCCAFLWRCLA